MRLAIKVVPKASRDSVAGWLGDALKVCVTAPPERFPIVGLLFAVKIQGGGVGSGIFPLLRGLRGSVRSVPPLPNREVSRRDQSWVVAMGTDTLCE